MLLFSRMKTSGLRMSLGNSLPRFLAGRGEFGANPDEQQEGGCQGAPAGKEEGCPRLKGLVEPAEEDRCREERSTGDQMKPAKGRALLSVRGKVGDQGFFHALGGRHEQAVAAKEEEQYETIVVHLSQGQIEQAIGQVSGAKQGDAAEPVRERR
jgi:hypothetical protein